MNLMALNWTQFNSTGVVIFALFQSRTFLFLACWICFKRRLQFNLCTLVLNSID